MVMATSLVQLFVLSFVLRVLWKYFRQVFLRSPLDNLPGPPPEAFLSGKQLVAF